MGLNSLLFHAVLSSFANNFLLVGDNFVTKNLSLVLRSSVYFLIASVLFFNQVPKLKDTYFGYLGLPTNASHEDVLKSYDKLKEFLQTGSPAVVEKLKRAYEVLSNQETRVLYSLYGDVGIDAKTSTDFALIVLTVSMSYYVISSIVFCVLNRSNRLKFARYVCILYNAVAFFLEIELRFLYADFMRYVFYLNRLLPYQHVEFLRAMPTFVMMLASLVSHFFVEDVDKLNLHLWQSTVATNTVILERMADVVGATEHLKSLGREKIKDLGDPSKEGVESSSVGDFFDSLDEKQKQRLMDLLNSKTGKSDKSKFLDFLKPTALYFVMFFLLRFFFK